MDSIRSWVETVHRRLQEEQSPADPPSELYPPASFQQVELLEAELEADLPRSYRQFLVEVSNGWGGFWFGLALTGTDGPARAELEAQLAEASTNPEAEERLDWGVVLGANAEEDLYLLYDPEESGPEGEPPVEIHSIGEGFLQEFDSFAHLLRTLAGGERLPRTVPLDLEQQFRAWEAGEETQAPD